MQRVVFLAYGHENVIGSHRTTTELTSEDFLTTQGTCIVGIGANLTLNRLDQTIKNLAKSGQTKIILRLSAGNHSDEIIGRGSKGLTYSSDLSMVARTSSYECDRTLMVLADKAAANLDRKLVSQMQISGNPIECEIEFVSE
ncbi:MAG: DUF371 domain-containing protein [Candidatus Thorarchaeota archaeon]